MSLSAHGWRKAQGPEHTASAGGEYDVSTGTTQSTRIRAAATDPHGSVPRRG
jgi:hypothetical protein